MPPLLMMPAFFQMYLRGLAPVEAEELWAYIDNHGCGDFVDEVAAILAPIAERKP